VSENLAKWANGRFRPTARSLDLSPFVLKGLEPVGERGTTKVPSSTEGTWMRTQNNLIVVGIDVAMEKVDPCIRLLSLTETWLNSEEARAGRLASQVQRDPRRHEGHWRP
jgi:hypothetical protein